jgi:hypothetical protein
MEKTRKLIVVLASVSLLSGSGFALARGGGGGGMGGSHDGASMSRQGVEERMDVKRSMLHL